MLRRARGLREPWSWVLKMKGLVLEVVVEESWENEVMCLAELFEMVREQLLTEVEKCRVCRPRTTRLNPSS